MKALGLDDNKKVGMFMMLISILTYTIGVILLFQRVFIIVSNFCFLAGMYFFIGFKGSFMFYRKKGKRRGSLLYFAGLIMILLHLTLLGSIVQLIGLFIIFKSFLPDIYDSITKIPYIGRYLKSYTIQNFLDNISTNNRSSRI